MLVSAMFRCLALLILFFSFLNTAHAAEPVGEESRFKEAARLLEERDIAFEEVELFSEYGVFTSSIEVFLPAPRPPRAAFVLAVPLTSDASMDGAIRVVFLGGEHAALPDSAAHTGLRALLSRLRRPEQTAVWYFTAPSPPAALSVTHGAAGYVAPLQTLRALPDTGRKYGVPCVFPVTNGELFRLGLADGTGAFALAEEYGVNMLCVQGAADGGAGVISAEALSALIIDYAESLDFSEDADTYYLIRNTPIGGVRFISGEVFPPVLLAGAALLLAIFLVLSAVRRRVILPRWRMAARYLWVLPLHFAALYAALLLTRGILRSAALQSPPDNAAAFLLIACAAIFYTFLAAVLDRVLIDRLHIPGRVRFCGYAAVLFIIADCFFLISKDIALTPLCAGALVFVILGASVRNSFICWLSGFMIPAQAFSFFYELVEDGNAHLAAFITDSSLAGTILLSLMMLPSLFLFQRGRLLVQQTQRKKNTRRKKRSVSYYARITGLIAVFSGAAVLMVFLARENTADDAAPTAISPAPEDYQLSIQTETRDVLARRSVDVVINGEPRPLRLDISLQSDAADNDADPSSSLYAALFDNQYIPFRENEQGRTDFTLGENPPIPFTWTLVAGEDFSGTLYVRVRYLSKNGNIFEAEQSVVIGNTEIER